MTWWNEIKGWHFMWSYVHICPLFDLLPLGRPWNCTTCFEMARALSIWCVFVGSQLRMGTLWNVWYIYRIWNIKVCFDLWLFDDLKMSMSQLLVVSTKKKRCFNRAEQVLYSAALKACQLGTHWQQAMLLFQDPASSPTLGVRDTWGYTIILNIIVIPRLGYNGI